MVNLKLPINRVIYWKAESWNYYSLFAIPSPLIRPLFAVRPLALHWSPTLSPLFMWARGGESVGREWGNSEEGTNQSRTTSEQSLPNMDWKTIMSYTEISLHILSICGRLKIFSTIFSKSNYNLLNLYYTNVIKLLRIEIKKNISGVIHHHRMVDLRFTTAVGATSWFRFLWRKGIHWCSDFL